MSAGSIIDSAKRRPFYILGVVLLVFVIYIILHWNTNAQEDYLTGFWVAEDAFCEEAEIDSLLMYIGEYKGGKRECYIVITDDVTNQAFTLTYSTAMSGPGVSTYRIRAKVEFDEDQIWGAETAGAVLVQNTPRITAANNKVDIITDMRDGTIRISSGDKLYVRARKQHEVTEAAEYLAE